MLYILNLLGILLAFLLPGMAKVDGPLFSLEARGQVGQGIVFFPWKGRHVVRQWLKPANPKQDLQGYVRAVLKTIGKHVSKIVKNASFYNGIVAKCPAGLNWNAFHGQGFLSQCIVGGTFDTAAFLAIVTQYSTHTATTAWNALATTLALADFVFTYGYTDTIAAGFQLYAGALAAYANSASWGTAYTDAPADLAASDITLFYSAHLT